MGLRFPNEPDDYRRARNELLEAEKRLRRQIEEVAALRRKLPLGGKVREDYVFDEGAGVKTRLSELFGEKKTLVLYSFMYGPPMERPCPSCTSIVDGLDGQAVHIRQRAAFAVVMRATIDKAHAVAEARGWEHHRVISSANNTFNRDYFAEREGGGQNPLFHVFTKAASGELHHFWSSELLFAEPEPKQDPRHGDLMWPLWNVLDLTPEGRGDFRPRLSYDQPE